MSQTASESLKTEFAKQSAKYAESPIAPVAKPFMLDIHDRISRIGEVNGESQQILLYILTALVGIDGSQTTNSGKPDSSSSLESVCERLDYRESEANSINHNLKMLRDRILGQ